jgi:thiol-disulfide isomerase/thioredoxin
MKKHFLLIFYIITSFAHAQNKFKAGIWRGVLTLSEKKNELILPFNFNVKYEKNNPVIEIINAEEKIRVNEVIVKGDSVLFKMPIFDSEFKTKLKNDTLYGMWFNHSRKDKNRIPFEAYYNDKNRFVSGGKDASVDFNGKYEVTFEANTPDEYKAVGVFKQQGNKVTGTFLTETGDYRYLEGIVQSNIMALSCFDGAHAFLFFARSKSQKGKADSLSGKFFSGLAGSEEWVARRNDTFKLKDPENLTYLKNPQEKINFTFKNLSGEPVSLSDKKYENKPVIIQIMGSWCPNCMDESAYLAELYKKYKGKGLEIIGIAYEKTDNIDKATRNLTRLKDRFGIEYDILITGLTGKAKASESLPFLNKVMAFPTTIIVDKKHMVRSIYTGFNGPATGKLYEEYKQKNEALINKLLKE